MKKDSLKQNNFKNYIYTIPNFITLLRLLFIPLVLYLIVKDRIIWAVTLFVILSLSDKLDGLLARRLKQSSYYGGMFDAVTDSTLIFTTVLFLYLTNHITIKILLILFAPKVITFLLLTLLHKAEYKPTIFSRVSSAFFYIAIPLFLLEINSALEYLLILTIYILSLIHWVQLILTRINLKF